MTVLSPRELAAHYRQAPCLFLDCDGVIFDSNAFKLRACLAVLAEYPEPAVAEMARFWSANGGMSRQRKFDHFFRDLHPVTDVAAHVSAAVERFGTLSRAAFVDTTPIPEALLVARDAGPERSFVVSGADQAELRDIFAEKGLNRLFPAVFGSPTAKLDHVARILQERNCPAERALFVGDGGGDFEVSQRLGLPFVFLAQYSDWDGAREALAGAEQAIGVDTWTDLLALLHVGA